MPSLSLSHQLGFTFSFRINDSFLFFPLFSISKSIKYATITRPEISFSVNKVCLFMSKPFEQHWTAVKRILRYLKGTISWGLLFQPASSKHPFSFHAYCDADWASDPDDKRSTSGAAIFFDQELSFLPFLLSPILWLGIFFLFFSLSLTL